MITTKHFCRVTFKRYTSHGWYLFFGKFVMSNGCLGFSLQRSGKNIIYWTDSYFKLL